MKKLILITSLIIASAAAIAQSPKYIFYFIGDGMGPNQIEYSGGDSLNFAKFPVVTSISTFSASDSITDSAAAGTALACGRKTSNKTIGMNTNHTENIYSIAVNAKENNRKIGILTSVSIDHATPAAFYAHSKNRDNYTEIANHIPTTTFDIYAGSGLLKPDDKLYNTLKDSAYVIIRGANVAPTPNTRTIWMQEDGANVAELPFAINRKGGELTLPIMVNATINALQNADNGFLIMAEGGKIDWACHANKAPEMRGEVVDLAAAVDYAIQFYNKYPLETLIIVTADHETGGFSFSPQYNTKWTTGGHTSTKVPLYVMGFGAEKFVYCKDNTDIVKTLRKML